MVRLAVIIIGRQYSNVPRKHNEHEIDYYVSQEIHDPIGIYKDLLKQAIKNHQNKPYDNIIFLDDDTEYKDDQLDALLESSNTKHFVSGCYTTDEQPGYKLDATNNYHQIQELPESEKRWIKIDACDLVFAAISQKAIEALTTVPESKWFKGQTENKAQISFSELMRALRLRPWLDTQIKINRRKQPTQSISIVQQQQIRVGFIVPTLTMGGAERWTITLAKHFDRNKIIPSGIAVQGKAADNLVAEVRPYCPVIQGVGSASMVAEVSDLIVIWGTCQIPKFKGPIIVVSHTNNDWSKRYVAQHLEYATHLTAVSNTAASVYPDPRKVRVIPNGIELSRCKPLKNRNTVKASWGVGYDRLVGCVGRLALEKRPYAASLACTKLPEEFHPIIIGDGPGYKTISSIAKLIDKRTIVVEPNEQVGDILNSLDCLVSASTNESFNLTLVEAWACGLPTVSTNTGIVPEITEKYGKVTVITSDDPSPNELANAVYIAISESNRSVIDTAGDVAHNHLSSEAMIHNWESYLIEAC